MELFWLVAVLVRGLVCAPCERVDFNGDGAVDLFDPVAYVEAFAEGDMAADWDGDGVLTAHDQVGFLENWERCRRGEGPH